MTQGLRKLIALAGVGVILLTSCGGSDESSNRQRNSALVACATVSASVETGVALPNGGFPVSTTVELCESAAKFGIVGTDGDVGPFVEGDKKGTFGVVLYSDRSTVVILRLYDSADNIIGDEVISMSLKKNEETCNSGGPCKDGDTGLGGGRILTLPNSTDQIELPQDSDIIQTQFPSCALPSEKGTPQNLTSAEAGKGAENTATMLAYCELQVGLLKNLKDFNDARAFKDWVIPSAGDVRQIRAVLTDPDSIATSTVELVDGVYVGVGGTQGNPVFTKPLEPATFFPIRYVKPVPEYTVDASVSVSDRPASPTDEASDDPSGQPSNDQTANSAEPTDGRTLAELRNFKVGVDVSSGTWYTSFDYSDDEVVMVDELSIWVYDGETLVKDFVDAKSTWTSDGETRRSRDKDASDLEVDKLYTVKAAVFTMIEAGGENRVSVKSDMASFDMVLRRQASPPTGLAMSDDEVLSWQPAHASTNNFEFDPAVYPYQYRVSWRVADSNGEFVAIGDISGTQRGWEPRTFDPDVAYEFVVHEALYGADGNVVSMSEPSSSLITTPIAAAEAEEVRAAEIAALEASRAAAVECLKVAPRLELVLIDPTQRTVEETAPVNSDDRVRFSVIHPCINDSVAQLFFTVEEINPTTRVSMWRRSTDFETTGPVYIESPGRRLSPGPHTVIASARWFKQDPDRTGEAALVSETIEWTFEVNRGTENVGNLCQPSDVSLENRVVTVNCDGLERVGVTNTDYRSRRRDVSSDGRTVTLPALSDGWHRFGLSIRQEYYGSSRFDFMVCIQNCSASRLENEFTLTLDNDTAKVSVKQNSCSGDPRARIAEYVKISDYLYYSHNSAFRIGALRLSEQTPLELKLQPFTSALRAERRDYCLDERATVYSFQILNRVAAPVPALDEIVVPPFTEVLLEPDEVVSSEQTTIAVPNRVENVTIPSEVVAALAPTGGTVTVSIDKAEPEILEVDNDISLALPPTAKVISFRVTDSKGRVTVVSKPIVRLEEAEVVTQVDKAGETVPKVTASPTPELESSNSSTLYIAIAAVLAFVVLGGGVTVLRRRKG